MSPVRSRVDEAGVEEFEPGFLVQLARQGLAGPFARIEPASGQMPQPRCEDR
ncbi:hypothetical protein [Streptomyces sp. NBC_00842]|uniref:hypothetical protein n=1 Tax=unclassified Streptomyces TaxID=2593676 RepID=UPI00386524EE